MSTFFRCFSGVGLTALSLAAAGMAQTPAPRVVREHDRFRFLVDGKPFLMLGAQVHNSSAWPADLEQVWPQLAELGGNTLEVPIYWHDVEPEEGEFRFHTLDAILDGARRHGVRLVLLWFGTWKNGTMDYVPGWIKQAPDRFPRMQDRAGRPVRVLSPHATSNLEADRRAFAALMRHLRAADEGRYTVVMVQVQNEPGSLFTVRDFSPAAEREIASAVPAALLEALGREERGTWAEVFGAEADETFAAHAVATYVNAVARAGRAEYDLPLTVNVWLRERKSWERPGEQYPSGGATSNMLDLWKSVATEIDVIAPDIYVRDVAGYREVCASYSRPDNPLLVPETFGGPSSARYLFHAVGNADALGFAPFGFNRRDGETGLAEPYRDLALSYSLLHGLAPLVDELRGRTAATGRRMQAAIEEDQITQRRLDFDGWDVLVQWGAIRNSYGGEFPAGTEQTTGRALVLQRGDDEFFVAGFDSRVTFRPSRGRPQTEAELVTVEEGALVDGAWQATRTLNGDQVFFGLLLRERGTVLRVVLQGI